MLHRFSVYTSLLLVSGAVAAADAPVGEPAAKSDPKPSAAATPGDGAAKSRLAKAEADAKTLSGMSILGNQEAPKALVIVPWKSSQLGDTLGLSRNLDDARRPVDKDVFMRELAYYEIRSGSK
jgi:hypothetical protein